MSRTRTNTIQCPRCGATLELTPHPEKVNRMVAYCACNRGRSGDDLGPVFETNTVGAPVVREEVENDSPIG